MRFRGNGYRGHDPKWAFDPLSGEGARVKGGRFNPKGVAALYLALSIDGMIAEMSHGFAARFSPLTVCSYEIDVDDIVDLRTDAARRAAGVTLMELGCPWLADVAARREPASWRMARTFIEKGAAGILVPSFAVAAKDDAANLVLWKWGENLPHRVQVIDPEMRLPRNQESWR